MKSKEVLTGVLCYSEMMRRNAVNASGRPGRFGVPR